MKQYRFMILLFVVFLILFGCNQSNDTAVMTTQISENSKTSSFNSPSEISDNLFSPSELIYRGAFRLPGDTLRPHSFSYGGAAMTFNPRGNPAVNPGDNPGSLFIMGHNRMPYGELPDGNQVAEITIPAPVISASPASLNQAQFIQPFNDVAAYFFPSLVEIPRAGMQYLETAETGPLVHLSFGQHLQEDEETMVASHAWFNTDLSTPDMQGPWYIGNQSFYSVNEYIFEIPAEWAQENTGGRPLATGRFKDGGWSGMGPALFAYRPWIDSAGTPAAPNSQLEETVLLLYESSRHTNNIVRCLNGYQHPDEWAGGAWLTGGGEKSAVMFAGTKSIGERYWYGFINPAGPEYACVEREFIGQFTLCRLADGTPCPDESSATCDGHTSNRGWWTTQFQAQFIFYDPAQLAAVASGELESWEPQPYAYLDIDEFLFQNPSAVEPDMLGWGPQRRYRLGDVAYDRDNGWIYVLELFADEARPVVHAWQIESSELPRITEVSLSANPPSPTEPGQQVVFTAETIGGVNPHFEFYYRKLPGGSWKKYRSYSPGNTMEVAPNVIGEFQIGVLARSGGSSASYEAYTYITHVFAITPVQAVTLTTNPPSPAEPGQQVTFSAQATGGINPEYRFYYRKYPDGRWKPTGPFSSTNTFSAAPNTTGDFEIGVLARSSGSILAYEAQYKILHSINWP